MMPGSTDHQRTIVDWFDDVYRRKGTRYLRPLKAYYVFLELLKARPEQKLLDVACGLGVLLQAATEYTPNLHGIDVSAVAIAHARKRLPRAELLVGNAEHLPYESGTFDLITCLGSLERMIDRRAALAEMRRVGRSGARYCFLVRNSNTRSWQYLAGVEAQHRSGGHADADTIRNWTDLFESAGFRIGAVLPDQYPLHRGKIWGSFFLRRVDFKVPIASRRPIERANSFVFLLDKPP